MNDPVLYMAWLVLKAYIWIFGKEWIWEMARVKFVVQLLSRVWFFATPWTAAHQAPLSSTVSRNLLKFMSIESVMLSYHLIFCYPLLLLPTNFPSMRVFSSESALHIRWSKYWSFNSSQSSQRILGLISFRIDGFDFLAIQGTLQSLLQHQNWSEVGDLKLEALQYSSWEMIIEMAMKRNKETQHASEGTNSMIWG